MTYCYMTGKCQNLTLNQRVPGSSPGAPTIKALILLKKLVSGSQYSGVTDSIQTIVSTQ